jgi:hypothetical protein
LHSSLPTIGERRADICGSLISGLKAEAVASFVYQSRDCETGRAIFLLDDSFVLRDGSIPRARDARWSR